MAAKNTATSGSVKGNAYQLKIATLLADLCNDSSIFEIKYETEGKNDGVFDDIELKETEGTEEKVIKFQAKNRDQSRASANQIDYHKFLYDKDFSFYEFFSTYLEKFVDVDEGEFDHFVLVTNVPMSNNGILIDKKGKLSQIHFEKVSDADFIFNRFNALTKRAVSRQVRNHKGEIVSTSVSYKIVITKENIEFLEKYLLCAELIKSIFNPKQETSTVLEKLFIREFQRRSGEVVTLIKDENGGEKRNVVDEEMFKKMSTYL
jgi:hypothetical protein